MSIWYSLLELLPVEMLRWEFMKNALLVLLLVALLPLLRRRPHLMLFSRTQVLLSCR